MVNLVVGSFLGVLALVQGVSLEAGSNAWTWHMFGPFDIVNYRHGILPWSSNSLFRVTLESGCVKLSFVLYPNTQLKLGLGVHFQATLDLIESFPILLNFSLI